MLIRQETKTIMTRYTALLPKRLKPPSIQTAASKIWQRR